MKKIFILLNFIAGFASAQSTNKATSDTIKQLQYLDDITVVGRGSKSDYQQMPEIVGTNIYAGKKNALIILDNVQGNVVTNTMRQVLSKVPGIHIWESDGSGIQIGIAARGLSPNRSWEFNVRQNGYDIAADPFGYPEAYYNPPLQSVQRIEIVRGQGALQYGPQFGGMINYILRNGSDITKPVQIETQQTIGSNNLINTYNAIGGKSKKIHYYTFFDHRNGDGWRENSRYFTNADFGTFTYQIKPTLSLTVELMHSNIRSQQPGGLTDSLIYADAQKSLRPRNWFDISWTNPAITLNYQINEKLRWNTKLFATIGNRNSVGFLQSILVKDSINPSTNTFNNRTLNIDRYRNYGLESRMLYSYNMLHIQNSLSVGIRAYTGSTYRRAEGKGTTESNYDMQVLGLYPKDISFKSNNAAVFAENVSRIGKKLLIIPGIRYEWLGGEASGRNGFATNGDEIILQNIKRSRSFILAGIGAEFHLTKSTEFYANYSQAYRPIQFANLQAPPSTDVVDPDLKDAKGYNMDIGYRGKVKNYLQFDVSSFYLQYNNRIGAITPQGANYRLITNVGASTSKGFEGYVELNIMRAIKNNSKAELSAFVSYSYVDARYSAQHKDANLQNKKVENAPTDIVRGGISVGYSNVLLTAQYSFVGNTFSDATNTVAVSPNSQVGLIPSYSITDLTVSSKIFKDFNIKAGLNNLFDNCYFTRRAGGYPGPGALPSDGRTFFVSIGAKL